MTNARANGLRQRDKSKIKVNGRSGKARGAELCTIPFPRPLFSASKRTTISRRGHALVRSAFRFPLGARRWKRGPRINCQLPRRKTEFALAVLTPQPQEVKPSALRARI